MTARKQNNGRRAPRSHVTPFEIKGQLIYGDGNNSDTILIWNISDSGLCLWATEKFPAGAEIILKITHPWDYTLQSIVRWARPVKGRTGFLLGLEVLDDQTALAEIHKTVKASARTG
jgi:hypothetical protein